MIKLKKVELSHFKNILNSGPVSIQPDVTCLVGKNESGKTAFLQALHRLNPAQPNAIFNAQRQYPAWLEKQHRRQKNLDEVAPVSAEFELDGATWDEIESKFGKASIASRQLNVSRRYNGQVVIDFVSNESAVLAHMARDVDFSSVGAVPTTLAAYDKLVTDLGTSVHDDEEATQTDRASAAKLVEGKSKLLEGAADVHGAITKFLEAKVPLFFYFDEYSQLPGSVRIRHILETEKEKLSPAELAFETMLSSRDIDLIHRAMIGRFFWFEHVGRFDWYRSYQEHGLLPADPNRAEGGPLPPTVGVTLPDHRHFVCLRPIDTTGSTPTRGDEQFRMAFANTDLPKEIGLDYSHARTTSLVADIQAQNPAWEESDVFIEVAHRLGSFASFKSIDRHALRVWTKGAPPKNPASWPALIHTEPREVEVF